MVTNYRLQNQAQQHTDDAADQVIPEIGEIELGKLIMEKEQDEDQHLGRQCTPENSGTANTLDEERYDEQGEHDGIENRADDVDGLNQILDQVCKQRKGNGHQAPEQREPSGGGDIMRVAGFAFDQVPVEI